VPEARLPRPLREQIARRAGDCCEYCRSQARFATQSFSVEHIVPRSRGGETEPENLAYSCQGCNNAKYAKTQAVDPQTGEQAPLFHPRRQPWGEHFDWSEDYTLVLGLTPTGRATIAALDLNRAGLKNLRRILFTVGEHPPAQLSATREGS
jgi:hypothetical protein